MATLFVVKGINPATGKVVQLTLQTQTALEAKAQAENAGLKNVTVTPGTPGEMTLRLRQRPAAWG